MFTTQGTTVQTWHASIAHKRPVQQPIPAEAAPDSPAAGCGTNAEIRQKSDYGQSPQTSNSKRRRGPEDSPGLAGHARASRQGHRDAYLCTRSCPRCRDLPSSSPRNKSLPSLTTRPGSSTGPSQHANPARQGTKIRMSARTPGFPQGHDTCAHEDCTHPGEPSSHPHRLG